MEYSKVENLKYVRGGLINADVTFDLLGTLPFLVNPDDTEPHSKKIHKEILAGKWGKIAPEDEGESAHKDSEDARALRDSILISTQWMVDRHRDEVELGGDTAISKSEYAQLLAYRKALRNWPEKASFPSKAPTKPTFLSNLRTKK